MLEDRVLQRIEEALAFEVSDFSRESELGEASGCKALEKAFIEISCLSATPHRATGTAGFPCTTVIGGID